MQNQTNLAKLNDKISVIVEQYSSLKQENEALRMEIVKLKVENEVKNHEMEKLLEQNAIKDSEIESIVEKLESIMV
ncbi:MAG: hypothetical protein A3E21_09105 [Sulfurimonas sp. RIFCSPHIGHO2_12_FULL_36_9]|jgi:vacuolar-type H+-ATPase subunit D/Vma8|uniref:hypothetical protein n=1 Tax=Sulfurimonas sp. RIFCSPLOWO2_12_36_12 TaxID=1802253 RepID=UPI0008AF9417|nr:hypothetical protein [Sulfurimonas sp. RIFCSPLOWO2_12_36_12]OHD97207.1 MAG: hypothetical protein A3E21_09105 [Sulfurimonas sp. RIFCSPHIGHO2_12_FULL_36_9]OHE00106.1 MAG: hypothetical protein A3J26_00790 [Sulfurimonas sp. RIFCSPLOWO2_02_FULL_36_28]OHE03042.1 MAG: hypothetical protein A2W82_08245 [Sulfurimonas sp. RIFCSPLOWO2_12_36_12]OHE05506.1 MAG: hypothetical protein A3K14_03435 [Sulfurimonas sp. RIFCSPLOWO2_12_FULL_36_74]